VSGLFGRAQYLIENALDAGDEFEQLSGYLGQSTLEENRVRHQLNTLLANEPPAFVRLPGPFRPKRRISA
jgi:hypothetical protein